MASACSHGPWKPVPLPTHVGILQGRVICCGLLQITFPAEALLMPQVSASKAVPAINGVMGIQSMGASS